jgi:hypothetical protein
MHCCVRLLLHPLTMHVVLLQVPAVADSQVVDVTGE